MLPYQQPRPVPRCTQHSIIPTTACRRLYLSARGALQIECYPHPTLIEIFGLDYRLAYKKGLAKDKRAGQIQLAPYLLSLANHPQMPMQIPSSCADWLQQEVINDLKGTALKQNEDRLDALVCLYIAFRHRQGQSLCFGSTEQGHIVI